MKNILKYLLLSLFIVSITSCDNEDQTQLVIIPSGNGEITAPAMGAKYVLNPEEVSTNPALTLTWNAADYDVPTEIKYTVQFAKAGTDFTDPFIAGSTTNLNLSWNIQEFNGAAVSAGLDPFVEGELEIRVISTVGSNDVQAQMSEVITILVTPFTTDLPTIAVPGAHQGWDPATAPLLASSGFGETDYEGYVWLVINIDNPDEGTYKFVAPDQTGGFFWGNTDWGDDGTESGILVEEDEVNCKVEEDGYYLVKADTDKLTYSTESISWAITGEATPLGWPSGTGIEGEDHDLTYDPETRTLFIDIDLKAGGWKFRANDDWAFEFGSLDDDGYLTPGGDYTFEGPAGNYRVVLDLSNPRAYTYTITAN